MDTYLSCKDLKDIKFIIQAMVINVNGFLELIIMKQCCYVNWWWSYGRIKAFKSLTCDNIIFVKSIKVRFTQQKIWLLTWMDELIYRIL